MKIITSVTNPKIKIVKALKDKKNRNEKGLYFIEGIRFFEEAIIETEKSNVEIEEIFISDSFSNEILNNLIEKTNYKNNLNINVVPNKLFLELSDTSNPQGILAIVKMKRWKLEDILFKEKLILLLDSVQDPGNLGTIIRTADAAGFSGVIASKGTVDIYNPKVLRATMGSVFRIPFIVTENLSKIILELQNLNIKVYGAHLDGKTSLYNTDLKKDVAIVIGNEGAGMSEEVKSVCDGLLKIEMLGRVESLNASVASGIIIYESLRQRICI